MRDAISLPAQRPPLTRPRVRWRIYWNLFGFGLIAYFQARSITVAGVQLIPKEYGEAADVFGATTWQRFTRVTLPLLKPSIQTALILRTVLAFEMFAIVLSIGGRNFPVLVSEAFNWQYNQQDFGVAAAYAVIVMGVSLAVTLIYLWALRTPAAQR